MQKRPVQARLVAEAEMKLRSPGFQIPAPSYIAGSSGSLSSWLWKLISNSFPKLLTSQFGHVYNACPSVHACMHMHTFWLFFVQWYQKSFPTIFCHSPALGLPDTACGTVLPIWQFQAPCFLLTRTLLLQCFPTSIQMQILYLPRTPVKPFLLFSHHCSWLRLPSQGSTGTLTSASPARVLEGSGTLALVGSVRVCSILISISPWA